MTTINLHQNQQQENSFLSEKGGNSGLIFSLLLLVGTFLVFGGVKMYLSDITKKNVALGETIKNENNKIIELKDLENVIDMQSRLGEIKTNLQINNGIIGRRDINNVLDGLAGELDAGVTVSDFKYGADGINISFDANNFGAVSKQVLNFKKSEKFSSIEVKDISRNEKAIACNVVMQLKK